MTDRQQPLRRGRPPSITRDRIAQAGLRMGLARLTFVGLAELLGVSHMALYRHVPNLEALRLLVAEEAFGRWQVPAVQGRDLEAYLLAFQASLRELVMACPGLATYLFRRTMTTPAMMAKITEHHSQIAQAYDLPREKAGWLLSTVAFHCIALADTIYTTDNIGGIGDETVEASFTMSMRALILGGMLLQGVPVRPGDAALT